MIFKVYPRQQHFMSVRIKITKPKKIIKMRNYSYVYSNLLKTIKLGTGLPHAIAKLPFSNPTHYNAIQRDLSYYLLDDQYITNQNIHI